MTKRVLFSVVASTFAATCCMAAKSPSSLSPALFMQNDLGWRNATSFQAGVLKGNYIITTSSPIGSTSTSFESAYGIGFNGYKLEVENITGYTQLFDLKLRASFGQNISGDSLQDGGNNYVAEADTIVSFRFNVNKSAQLNLLPSAGFSWRQFYEKNKSWGSPSFSAENHFNSFLGRILAPLVGLNVEISSPLRALYANLGLKAFLPSAKARVIGIFEGSTLSGQSTYHGARHGLGASAEFKYKLTEHFAVSAKLDYEAFNLKGGTSFQPAGSTLNRANFSTTFTSALIGVDYFF